MNIEFKAWPKITRKNPFMVTITEKIDGTNACIVIEHGEVVAAQSRKRFISPDDDNYGFAAWVEAHKNELKWLGDGYHYGEWAGVGIQKNPLNMDKKRFFLFNTWSDEAQARPDCCDVVPVLFEGEINKNTIQDLLDDLRADVGCTHEGVCVYWHAFNKYTKHTLKNNDGKWVSGNCS